MSDIPQTTLLRLMRTSAQIQIAVAHHTADLIAFCDDVLGDERAIPSTALRRPISSPPDVEQPTSPETSAEEQITRQRKEQPRNWCEPDMGLTAEEVPEETVDAKAEREGGAYEQLSDDPGSAVDKAFEAGDQGLRALGRD